MVSPFFADIKIFLKEEYVSLLPENFWKKTNILLKEKYLIFFLPAPHLSRYHWHRLLHCQAMVLAGNMAATMKCCEQAMILAREVAALSVSVIPLYVLLQRFCNVMSSCHHSISCGENAVSVSAWCTASHRTVVVKCSTGSSFSFQAMILALSCRRNGCLEDLSDKAWCTWSSRCINETFKPHTWYTWRRHLDETLKHEVCLKIAKQRSNF